MCEQKVIRNFSNFSIMNTKVFIGHFIICYLVIIIIFFLIIFIYQRNILFPYFNYQRFSIALNLHNAYINGLKSV